MVRPGGPCKSRQVRGVTAAKGQMSQAQKTSLEKSPRQGSPCQSCLGQVCRKGAAHWPHCSCPLHGLWDSCTPRMLGRASTSTRNRAGPASAALSSPSLTPTCAHLHGHTHSLQSAHTGAGERAHHPFFSLHSSETSILCTLLHVLRTKDTFEY